MSQNKHERNPTSPANSNHPMLRLNSRQWTAALALVALVALVAVSTHRGTYTLKDISGILQSIDERPSNVKVTNNNSPEMLERHRIEVQVNDLLKKKIKEELQLEREEMEKQKESWEKEKDQQKQKVKEAELKVKEAEERAEEAAEKAEKIEAGDLVTVEVLKETGQEPNDYIKHVYSYSAQSPPTALSKREKSGSAIKERSSQNELAVLASIDETFGKGRTYEHFFELINGIGPLEHSKMSLALLIRSKELFDTLDSVIAGMFETIGETKDVSTLKDSFSRVTLLHAPFLEKKLTIDKSQKQASHLQKDRRRVLSLMRNFLLNHGIVGEEYSLFIDADMVELPQNFLQVMIDSKVDIATTRVDMKTNEGNVVHSDYDRNAWAGDRTRPSPEEEQRLDEDPDFIFEPRSGPNNVHFLQLSRDPEKYGMDRSPEAKCELTSVGGALLFVRSVVFKMGVQFPPLYIIGTNWNRLEGWDGIETEGLCYQANAVGFKCWGFPQLTAYHSA